MDLHCDQGISGQTVNIAVILYKMRFLVTFDYQKIDITD